MKLKRETVGVMFISCLAFLLVMLWLFWVQSSAVGVTIY